MTTKEQRRRELARAKLARQQARRQQQERARRRLAIIGAAVAVVLVVAGATYLTVRQNDDDTVSSPGTSDSVTPSATSTVPAGECQYRPTDDAAKPVDPPPDGPATASGTYQATITTTQGVIDITLNADIAPCTVESFLTLASAGYFNDTPCHRLTTSDAFQVLQCGDPSGKGTGGPGYEFNDELSPDITYKKGTVAMANSGPNTNGSQFFLVYGDTTLAPNYTVFGTITQGFDVLAKISAGGSKPADDGKPKLDVTITSLTVTGWPPSTAPSTTPPTTPSMTPSETSSATPSGTPS